MISDWLNGRPMTRCVVRACSSPQNETGFCTSHHEQMRLYDPFMVEVNRRRDRIGHEPVRTVEEDRLSSMQVKTRSNLDDIDPALKFQKMERQLGLRPGTLWACTQDPEFDDDDEEEGEDC
jgi:hypothetical protein